MANVPSNSLLQLRGPAAAAAALSRKFLRDLTTVRHCKKFFCNTRNRNIYNDKLNVSAARQQFSVRGSISVTARPRTRAA
jgi:hypothetical protein